MPEIKDVMRVLRLVKDVQPVHAWGLAEKVGFSEGRVVWAWRWLQYLHALGLVKKVSDLGGRTGRKQYMLTETGEILLSVLEAVFGKKNVAMSMYRYTEHK